MLNLVKEPRAWDGREVGAPDIRLASINSRRRLRGPSARPPGASVGKALGVSRSTVVRWERDGTRPDPESAEGAWFAVLVEIKRLAERLWPDDPDATRRWFRSTMIPAFRGRRPIDVLRSPKGLLHIYHVLLAETEGGYS